MYGPFFIVFVFAIWWVIGIYYFLSIIFVYAKKENNEKGEITPYVIQNWTKKYPCDNLYGVSHKIAYLIGIDNFGKDNHHLDYSESGRDRWGNHKLYYKGISGNEIPKIYLEWTNLPHSFVKIKILDDAWSVICMIQKNLCDELWKRLDRDNLRIEKITPSSTSTNSPD